MVDSVKSPTQAMRRCAALLATDAGTRTEFREETGMDLGSVGGDIGAMIAGDSATGQDREIVVAWCKWVAKKLGGTGDGREG